MIVVGTRPNRYQGPSVLNAAAHKTYNSGEHLFAVQKLGGCYNATKAADPNCGGSPQHCYSLHFSLLGPPRLTAGSSPRPLHAAPQAFHAGTAGQPMASFSLNNAFIVIHLAFAVDL